MHVGVIGAGYVGLVTAAGLASIGHRVRVGESDERKLETLKNGKVPFHEADLERIVAETIEKGLLTFHHDNLEVVASSKVVLLALPTPPAEDGSADLRYIDGALRGFAAALEPGTVVATKSTVPVGSVARFQAALDDLGVDAVMVSNPEFLREGSAVADFFHPDRIVIGSTNQAASETLMEMYRPIQAPMIITDPESSELIKYASNAYLATRITFANAIANVCERVGADAKQVLEGMGYDRRIGFHFLNPGPGYGGSCFPKDTQALVAIAKDAGYEFSLLQGVIDVNEDQLHRTVNKVADAIGSLEGSTIAMWGLAFKAGTDDVRESPAVRMGMLLIDAGARVVAYDPAVKQVEGSGIEVVDDPVTATSGADVLLIATEWPEFAAVDLRAVRDALAGSTIVDARNILDPLAVEQLQLAYVGIGR